jgi:CheY-like chemotaxis protein
VPRVLLVDDSPHAQRMGVEILSQQGYEVLGITDGAEAFVRLREFAPDLVLADVAMCSRSGYELCDHIKSDPAWEHVKVILLAGAMDPLDAAEAQRVRADAVLHKPFEPSVVLGIVAPLLGAPAAAPPRRARAPRGEFEDAVDRALERPRVLAEEQIRAAVVLAVESALPAFVEEVTRRVVETLSQRR